MGNQAIYLIHEKGKTTGFAAHYGANALSPLWRMLEAQQLQFELGPHLSITHLFEHLDYEGNYQNPRLADEDMFCRRIPDSELSSYNEAYKKGSLYEMRVLFELDKNGLQMEYNPNCPWYRTMGCFSIDLDVGLENVRTLLAHEKQYNITDFGRLVTIYQNSTGITEKLESARGAMWVEEYMDSPQAEEDRRRYRAMVDSRSDADEEMEEQ